MFIIIIIFCFRPTVSMIPRYLETYYYINYLYVLQLDQAGQLIYM